ncbi:MAG: hypothetical protein BWK76_04240 [Desulfobulbaceae bacterium A2]|nr:MAG: hypothetical protein BWK76_04240 [Desulfobulbaceae bacterium A2]
MRNTAGSQREKKRTNTLLLNVIFFAACGGILLFLLRAPAETTARLPDDADHHAFRAMGKKEAEKHCEKCHAPEGVAPLPVEHPPKYRCLFCHKR